MAQQGVLRDPILFANFNQDFTSVSVGTQRGFAIFKCDPFEHILTLKDGPRRIVEMLFSTNVIVLCGSNDHPHADARVVQVLNVQTKSLICELLFPSPVAAVKMSRRRLVIVLSLEVYIYDLSDMRLCHIYDTHPNPKGIIAFSPSDSNPFLALPSPTSYDSPSSFDQRNVDPNGAHRLGKMSIFNTDTLETVRTICAHDAPLSCIAINQSGSLLSSSSAKGTVIRVWAVPSGEHLYQFRRVSREADITFMSFNIDSTMLTVSSAHVTIHLFKLDPEGPGSLSHSSTLGNYGSNSDLLGSSLMSSSIRSLSSLMARSVSSSFGEYASGQWSEGLLSPRAFAYLRLPSEVGPCKVGFSSDDNKLMVIANDGYLRIYEIDTKKGGECSFVSYHSLCQSTQGFVNTNYIEKEILHWILVEGKKTGSMGLETEDTQCLLDSIQEILAFPVSQNDDHFLIQLLFEIQDNNAVFQHLHNRNTRYIAEYLQKASTPIHMASKRHTGLMTLDPLDPYVLTELREKASDHDVSSTLRRLRRLLLRLALAYDKLPHSLLVAGVTCASNNSIIGGGFADIFVGSYKGQAVALKRLRVFQIMEPSRRIRVKRAFYHESLVWWNLSHPHIVPFLGICDDIFPGIPCMVMPFMDEGNIRHVVDLMVHDPSVLEHTLLVRVHNWLKEISLGLAYLHREEVIHGDLRGVNILINDKRMACLCDFGLAVFAGGTSKNYASIRAGADRWLAPELLDPERFGFQDDRPTYAGDIYSFACVCLELYTGQDPFPGISHFTVAKHVIDGYRPPRPRLHEKSEMGDVLWRIMELCWSQSPTDRPAAEKLVAWVSEV